MDHNSSEKMSTKTQSELQALIAAIPHELSLSSPVSSMSKSTSSFGDLSSTSSSYLFPPLNDMTALSVLSLSGCQGLFGGIGLPMLPSIPYINATLPPHATIESLGLINSSAYHDRTDAMSMTCSPSTAQTDSRPRAFSSAATLQHLKPSEADKKRKRSRRVDNTSICDPSSHSTSTSSTSSQTSTSILRKLVEEDDDDLHVPSKKSTVATKEEEEEVQRKVQEFLKKHPIVRPPVDNEDGVRRPLQQIIRDEDLPDEVGPDSPFRHFPKYQQKSRTTEQLIMLQGLQTAVASMCAEAFRLQEMSDDEQAQQLQNKPANGFTLEDMVCETVRQELRSF